jgi:hypothetical protein
MRFFNLVLISTILQGLAFLKMRRISRATHDLQLQKTVRKARDLMIWSLAFQLLVLALMGYTFFMFRHVMQR